MLFLGGFALFGFSFLNDIKETKGRKTRKTFQSELLTQGEQLSSPTFAQRGLELGAPHWTRFTVKKERAAVHHH